MVEIFRKVGENFIFVVFGFDDVEFFWVECYYNWYYVGESCLGFFYYLVLFLEFLKLEK